MKLRALTLSVLMVFSVMVVGISFGPGVVTAANAPVALTASDLPGSGTSDDPYQISNASELQAIEDDLSANYSLVSDVDASETMEWDSKQGFDPIGFDSIGNRFNGSFDGNEYTITHLTINRSSEDNVGLFRAIGTEGEITDIHLESVDVSGKNTVGGLVAVNTGGVVSSSNVTGDINGSTYIGGVVGHNTGIVDSSVAIGNVTGTDSITGGLVGWNDGGTIESSNTTVNVSSGGESGGIVGENTGTVRSSYATGNVSGDWQTGGLIGWNDGGSVYSSYATGTVFGGGSDQIGGLVGWNDGSSGGGEIDSSYATGDVVGNSGSIVGGLVGDNEAGTITSSYATGDVNGYEYVGGLVGQSSGPVISSNASGTVTATSWEVGGLIGTNKGGTVDSSNATGDVSSDNEGLVGGLIGYNNAGTVNSSHATGNASGDWQIGGLIGWSTGPVNSSYATGNVLGTSYEVGGLVGWNDGGTVDNSYATGNVTGDADTIVGGLVGNNDAGAVNTSFATGNVSGGTDIGGLVGSNSGTVNDAYWDVNTTDQTTSAGGTGLTTTQLKANTSLNFNFGNIWDAIDNGTYISYPYLLDNTQLPEPGLELYDTMDPIAEAGSNQTVSVDTTVNFNGTGSSDNVGITSYEWDVDADNSYELSGAEPSHSYSSPGEYTVTLKTTDEAGNNDTNTVTITVEDTTSPTADAGSNQTVDEDTTVNFNGTGSSDNVGITSYEWDVDDDGHYELDNAEPSHTYSSSGEYTVTLKVTDGAGNNASDTVTVTVEDTSTSSGGSTWSSSDSSDSEEQDDTEDSDTSITFESNDTTQETEGVDTNVNVTISDPQPGLILIVNETNATIREDEEITNINNTPQNTTQLTIEIDTDRDFYVDTKVFKENKSSRMIKPHVQSFEERVGVVAAGYIQINTSLTSEEITNASLTFTVERSYLNTIGGDVGNITLYHQINTTTWEPQHTEYLGNTSTHHMFEGEVTNFSVFAFGTNVSQLEVTNVTVDEYVTVREPIQVTATLVNHGETNATKLVNATLDNEVVDSRNVTVHGGENETVALSVTICSTGNYTVFVDGMETPIIHVEDVEDKQTTTTTTTPTATPTTSPSTTTTDVDGITTTTETPGFTIGLALVALLGAAFVALRRRD